MQEQAAADAGVEVDVIYPEVAEKNVGKGARYKPFEGGRKLTKDVKLEPQSAGKHAAAGTVAPAVGCGT